MRTRAPPGLGGASVGAGADLVGGDAGLLAHGQDVDLVVGHAAALGEGQFGGADVHAAVELGGVGIDHLGSPAPARSPEPVDGEAPARAPDPVRAPVPVNGRSPVDGEGLDEVEGELGLAAGRRADDGHAHRRGPRGTDVAVHADANGAGAHGGAPHISGRRGPTRLRACVHEDRAVSRWSLSWVSVTPELRSVR